MAIKPVTINSLWDAQDSKAVSIDYKIEDTGEVITIRGKSDLDDEYETYLENARKELGIDDENPDFAEVSFVDITRMNLYAITHPEDRELWAKVEEAKGEPMGAYLMEALTEKMSEKIIEKKQADPSGGPKRS